MTVRSRQILLFGLFGYGNFGNDASAAAVCRALERIAPKYRVTCICCGDPKALKIDGVRAVPASVRGSRNILFRVVNRMTKGRFSRLLDQARILYFSRTSVALLVPGTGFFDDEFGLDPAGLPTDFMNWVEIAHGAGCRFGYISVGAGPIRDKRNRELFVRAAGLAEYRTYRDAASRDYMVALGVGKADDRVYPDLVFGLQAPLGGELPRGGGKTVAVGLIALFGVDASARHRHDGYRSYIRTMAEFIETLRAESYRVELIIGDVHDRVAVEDVIALLPEAMTGQMSWPQHGSFDEAAASIARADVVVASRFHNVVASLMLGKPTLCLAYNQKHWSLMASAGLSDYCLEVSDFEGVGLMKKFSLMLQLSDVEMSRVHAMARSYRASLLDQERELARFVGG